MLLSAVLLCLPVWAAPAPAGKSVGDAAAELRRQIAATQAELAAATQKVTAERRQVGQELDRLRQEVASLQAAVETADAERKRKSAVVAGMDAEAARLQQTVTLVDAILGEYRRAFETRLSPGEAELYRPELARIDALLNSGVALDRAKALDGLATLAQECCRARLGGHAFAGEALGADGEVLRGRFVQVGPVAYFKSDSGKAVGLAVQRVGSTRPTVFSDLPAEDLAAVATLADKGAAAAVPVDPALGEAVKFRQTRDTVLVHLRKGGIVMIPLLTLGAICAVLAVFKLVALRRLDSKGGHGRVREILEALRAGRADAALEMTGRLGLPLGPVLREGIQHRDAPKEHLEEILYERILVQTPVLERFLAPLAVGASAAPLLGLLGTVTGMIHTFKVITVFGTGDARVLSAGISEALITTEVGLFIAIPALLIHAYLSRRVRRAISMTQEAAIMFVNGLKLRADDAPGAAADAAPR